MPGETLRLKIAIDIDGQKRIERLNTSLERLEKRTGLSSQRSLAQTARGLDSIGKSAQKIALGGMTLLLAKFVALGFTLTALSRQFLMVNERFAQLEITIGSALKNVAAARDISKELAVITARSPIPFQQLSGAIQSFAVIPQTSQRLLEQTVQGTLGDPEGFMHRAIGLVEAMSTFRPDQGSQGAVFAIREAMGGQMRSLIRRFDIPIRLLTSATGKSLDDLKADPNEMIEAMMSVFENIISPEAIKKFSRQPTILLENFLEQIFQLPSLAVGRSGAYQKILVQLEKFFDDLNMFVSNEFERTFAGEMSDSLLDVFRRTTTEINTAFLQIVDSLGIDTTGKDTPQLFFEAATKGITKLLSTIPKVLSFLNQHAATFINIANSLIGLVELLISGFRRLASVIGGLPTVLAGILTIFAVLPNLGQIIMAGYKKTMSVQDTFAQGTTSVAQRTQSQRAALMRPAVVSPLIPQGHAVTRSRQFGGNFNLRGPDGRFVPGGISPAITPVPGSPTGSMVQQHTRRAGLAAVGGALGRGAISVAKFTALTVVIGALLKGVTNLAGAFLLHREFLNNNTTAIKQMSKSFGTASSRFQAATGTAIDQDTQDEIDKDLADKFDQLGFFKRGNKSIADILTVPELSEDIIEDKGLKEAERIFRRDKRHAGVKFRRIRESGILEGIYTTEQLDELEANIGATRERIKELAKRFNASFDISGDIKLDEFRAKEVERDTRKFFEDLIGDIPDTIGDYFREILSGEATGDLTDVKRFAESQQELSTFRSLAQLRSGITNNVLYLQTYDELTSLLKETDPLNRFFIDLGALDKEITSFENAVKGTVHSGLETEESKRLRGLIPGLIPQHTLEGISGETRETSTSVNVPFKNLGVPFANAIDQQFQTMEEYYDELLQQYSTSRTLTEATINGIMARIKENVDSGKLTDKGFLAKFKTALADFEDKGFDDLETLFELLKSLRAITANAKNLTLMTNFLQQLREFQGSPTLTGLQLGELSKFAELTPGGSTIVDDLRSLNEAPGQALTDVGKAHATTALADLIITWLNDAVTQAAAKKLEDESGEKFRHLLLAVESEQERIREEALAKIRQIGLEERFSTITNPNSPLFSETGNGRSVDDAVKSSMLSRVTLTERLAAIYLELDGLYQHQIVLEQTRFNELKKINKQKILELETAEKLLPFQTKQVALLREVEAILNPTNPLIPIDFSNGVTAQQATDAYANAPSTINEFARFDESRIAALEIKRGLATDTDARNKIDQDILNITAGIGNRNVDAYRGSIDQRFQEILDPESALQTEFGARSVGDVVTSRINAPVNAIEEQAMLTKQIADANKLIEESEGRILTTRELAMMQSLDALEARRQILEFDQTGEALWTRMGQSIRSQIISIGEMGAQIGTMLSQGLGNAFGDFVTGAASAKDAFRSFAADVLNQVARMFASQAVVMVLGALFGSAMTGIGASSGTFTTPAGSGTIQALPASTISSGSIGRVAEGGPITGGSGIRDDVPAMLMGGEFVLRKEAVQRIGEQNLMKMNEGMPGFNMGGMAGKKPMQFFAGGGSVKPMAAGTTIGKSEVHIHVEANGTTTTQGQGGGNDPDMLNAMGEHLAPLVQEEVTKMAHPGGFFDQWHRMKQAGF